jgi:hypothetical protein
VNKKMSNVLEQHEINVLKEFSTFADDVEKTVVPICSPAYKPLQMLFERVLTLNNIAKTQLSNIRKLGEKYAQEISVVSIELAAISLRPYTSKIGKETGFRVGKRMCDLLSAHIERTSEQMYDTMSQRIRNIVEARMNELFRQLVGQSSIASNTLYEDLMIIFKYPISQASAFDQTSLLALKAKLFTEGHSMEKAWTYALKKTDLQNETGGPSIEGEDSDDSDSESDDGDGGSENDNNDMTDEGSDEGEEDEVDQKLKELDIMM